MNSAYLIPTVNLRYLFNRVNVLKYFCILEHWDNEKVRIIDDKIVKVIGEDFEDALELKNLLISSYDKFRNILFISKYVIKSLE